MLVQNLNFSVGIPTGFTKREVTFPSFKRSLSSPFQFSNRLKSKTGYNLLRQSQATTTTPSTSSTPTPTRTPTPTPTPTPTLTPTPTPTIPIAIASASQHNAPPQVSSSSSSSSWNLLPDQLLYRIFHSCIHLSTTSTTTTTTTTQCDHGQELEAAAWNWMVVAQVCSSWRKVALSSSSSSPSSSSPSSWRYGVDFFSNSRSFALLSLDQPKTPPPTPPTTMGPLHINLSINQHNMHLVQRVLKNTKSTARPIRNIHLRSSSYKDISPFLELLLMNPDPAVESLVVRIDRSDDDDDDEDEDDDDTPKPGATTSFYYPRPLFSTAGEPLLNLKYMELHSAPFYLLSSRCTHLTELHLHDLPLSERPRMRHFLSVLERLQDLQHLTIDRSFPIDNNNNLELGMRSSTVAALLEEGEEEGLLLFCSLPKLKTLSLVGSMIEVGNMLECLDLPPTTAVGVKVVVVVLGSLTQARNHVWKLMRWISARNDVVGSGGSADKLVLSGKESGGSRFVGDSLDLNHDYRQSVRIQTFNDDDRFGGGGGGPTLDVSFEPSSSSSVEDQEEDDWLVSMLSCILCSLSLSQVRTLIVKDHMEFVTQKIWTDVILGRLLNVRVLEVDGGAPCGLAWALLLNARRRLYSCDRGGGGGGKDEQVVLVSRLDEIYLRNVDCSSGGYMLSSSSSSSTSTSSSRSPTTTPVVTTNSYYDLDDSRFLDVLNASLYERRLIGHNLGSMSIAKTCRFILKTSLEDARAMVGDLRIDGGCRCFLEEDDEDEDDGFGDMLQVQVHRHARYRDKWDFENPLVAHYYRLNTLAMDSSYY